MSLDGFWAAIEAQLDLLRTARTAADVVKILGGKSEMSSGDAFFAGSGGGVTPIDPLTTHAGWTVAWLEAHYHYALRAPDGGSFIEYVEGDVYVHNTLPYPLPNN